MESLRQVSVKCQLNTHIALIPLHCNPMPSKSIHSNTLLPNPVQPNQPITRHRSLQACAITPLHPLQKTPRKAQKEVTYH